jgi:aspartyl-tRNA(Asn)/glutamyl-tRNA(Gln) amidotransferase subunit C
MITDEQVRHLAQLAKLKLSDEEIAKFAPQLSEILGFFEMLQEVDTSGVEETSQVTGLTNVMKIDEIEVDGNEDALLRCSPLQIENHSVKVPRVI